MRTIIIKQKERGFLVTVQHPALAPAAPQYPATSMQDVVSQQLMKAASAPPAITVETAFSTIGEVMEYVHSLYGSTVAPDASYAPVGQPVGTDTDWDRIQRRTRAVEIAAGLYDPNSSKDPVELASRLLDFIEGNDKSAPEPGDDSQNKLPL